MKQILLGTLLGGLVMFFWLWLAHDALEIGQSSIKEIPNEAAVMDTLAHAMPEAGFYMFPGMGLGPNPTSEQKKAAMEKYGSTYGTQPHGLIIFHPAGGTFQFGPLLGKQLAMNFLHALLASLMLFCFVKPMGYAARAGFVAMIGLIASLTTNVEYWNWYQFPANYTVPYILTGVLGFALAGLAIAAVVKPAGGQAAG